jgi:hypothetical protein
MAGFKLDGYEGRIICPHCESIDCAGYRGETLICSKTGRKVTNAELRASGERYNNGTYIYVQTRDDLPVYKRVRHHWSGSREYFVKTESAGYVGEGDTIDDAVNNAKATLRARGKRGRMEREEREFVNAMKINVQGYENDQATISNGHARRLCEIIDRLDAQP